MLPGIISAGASLLGGLMNQNTQESINAANIAEQDKINNENIALQKEFAQNGIQWKVADAQAAGINPLAALGASTSSFSNIVGATQQASTGLGDAISKGGQDIGRALKDTMTAGDQHAATMAKLQETHGQLENDLLASQIAKYNSAGAGGPPTPAAGQSYFGGLDGQGPLATIASTATVKPTPASVTPVNPSAPQFEPGANPADSFIRVGPNSWLPVASKEYQGRTSNDTFSNMADFVRRRVIPTSQAGMDPPSVPIDQNHFWAFDPIYGYHQVPVTTRPFLVPRWMRDY